MGLKRYMERYKYSSLGNVIEAPEAHSYPFPSPIAFGVSWADPLTSTQRVLRMSEGSIKDVEKDNRNDQTFEYSNGGHTKHRPTRRRMANPAPMWFYFNNQLMNY